MSSFSASDETLESIATTILRSAPSYTAGPKAAFKILEECLKEPCHPEKLTHQVLFNMLRALNDLALNERYSDEPTAGTYSVQRRPFKSRYQAFKSLQCFLYQCSEGKAVDEPLYKILTEYKANLAMEIVQESDQYEKAVWG